MLDTMLESVGEGTVHWLMDHVLAMVLDIIGCSTRVGHRRVYHSDDI